MQRRTDGNVEGFFTENVFTPSPVLERQDSDVKTTESAENFQKSMYDLFEKNGVINDLRAYLRGHIVEVLRSARTGHPPACQKNFTQRLELPFQALNMLLAEYLLRHEYSYTLSVFVSEIPLANMVFAFAKSLMQGVKNTELQFEDEDVWSILNYLGMKCDSQHAANIVKMYKSEKQTPLLLCIFKCMPLYKEPESLDSDSTKNSLSSSVSLSSLSHKSPTKNITLVHDKCKHSTYCKVCKGKVLRMKEKYKKKKKNLVQNFKKTSVKPQKVDSLIKKIHTMERSFIDEMFQQLKSVYETEIEMSRKTEETRVKKAFAKHVVQLQQKRIEMEEKFKSRELELQCNIQQKKRFLWGLAQLLREQHAQMSRAMRDLRDETSRLAAKEDSLKSQLADAEQILHQRAEDMRQQISNELAVLENHLQSVKDERDTIIKERSELDHIRHLCENTNNTREKEEPRPHYDSQIIQKYLETVNFTPKRVMERSTITELADVTSRIDVVLNNGQDVERSSSENIVKDRMVNNLKKLKNVNVSQSNLDETYVESGAAPDEPRARAALRRLAEENERLRTFATQQREHIDELSGQQARLQAELVAARLSRGAAAGAVRPRTAPSTMPNGGIFMQRGNNMSVGWRAGAGEELSYLAPARPRLVLPGDAVPFVGVVRDSHNDNRRYLINQWRSLRRRVSPAVLRPTPAGRREEGGANVAGPSVRLPSTAASDEDLDNNEDLKPIEELRCQTIRERRTETPEDTMESRVKSSRSVLREAKERLKPKVGKLKNPYNDREQSPASVLREAKLRLRKLEIEAEAVEKSYLNFRRKQEALRSERRHAARSGSEPAAEERDLKQFRPSASSEAYKTRNYNSTSHENQPKTPDFSKYIEEYYAKYDIGESHFKNKNTTSVNVKPIPPPFTANEAALHVEDKKENYLETPIIEFRKYYHSEKQVASEALPEDRPKTSVTKNDMKSHLRSSIFMNHDKNLKSPTVQNVNSESESLSRSSLSLNVDNTISVKISPKSTKNRDSPESNTSGLKDSLPTTPGKLDIKNRPASPIARYTAASDSGSGSKKTKKETFRLLKESKAKELEILKENVTKLSKNNSSSKSVENAKWKIEVEKQSIIKETITEASRDDTASDSRTKDMKEDKNSLLIEIQSVSQVNDVKITESQTPQDLLLFVQSSDKGSETDLDLQKDTLPAQITIIVNPEKNGTEQPSEADDGDKSPAHHDFGEKSEDGQHLLNSTCETDLIKNVSSPEMQLDLTKTWLRTSELSANEDPDYPEDFSAEADNINSQRYDTDSDGRSPISVPKVSEKDDFWDS